MKKTIKMLGLVFVAACLFAGCANSSDSNDDKSSASKNLTKPLFDKDELTENVSIIDLADGKWIYRTVAEYEDSTTISDEFSFTVKDMKVDESADYSYKCAYKSKIPADFTEEDKAMYKENGFTFEGAYMIQNDSYSKAEIQHPAPENAHIPGNVNYIISKINELPQNKGGNYKTNSDNTQYYYSGTGTKESEGKWYNGIIDYYLAKN